MNVCDLCPAKRKQSTEEEEIIQTKAKSFSEDEIKEKVKEKKCTQKSFTSEQVNYFIVFIFCDDLMRYMHCLL